MESIIYYNNIDMRRYKTYKKKHSQRKTRRKCRTLGKKGGVNNNNNNEFIERRNILINNLRDIFINIEINIESDNEMIFIDEIRSFENEADSIDAHFGNNNMENILNQRIEDVMEIFNLINYNNNNNNNTMSIISARRESNNNNNKMSIISTRRNNTNMN